MGLEDIAGQVREKAQAEATSIWVKADAEADAVLEKAKAEAKEILDAQSAHTAELLGRDRAERLFKAKSLAARELRQAKHEAVEGALAQVWDGILKSRQGKEYARLMRLLAEKADKEIKGKSRLYCRAEDERLLDGYLIAGRIGCLGGVVAEDVEGKMRVDATIETLFDECEDGMAKLLYEAMFGGDP